MPKIDERLVQVICAEIGVKFRTFGGGVDSGFNNPISAALKDRPLQFAAGVDVADVVRLVMSEIQNLTPARSR